MIIDLVVRFFTYAYNWIRQAISKLVRNSNDIRIPMNGLTPPSGEPSPEFKNSLYKIVSAMKNKKCPESFDCQTVCSELYNSFSSSAFVNCVASCERGLGFPPVPVKKGIWEKLKIFL